ncbi:hypothetical protein ATANTOWER_006342 [Ataeniobius toweri]|uniref:S100P-binding protein n=1 Tax=Ataeniobius toweri TaxID=208326 RepID=A0ABU7AXE6_9TELE|nr:hypothetical protein [Ataeniobius toweri]
MDYSNSLTRNNSISPFAPPYPKLNEKTLRSEIKETVSSRVDLEHVHCSCSKDEEVQKPTNEEEKLDTAVVEDDRGYVSSFHLHENEECKTEGPHEQQGHKQSSACGQHFSFLIKDGSETVGGPLLGPVKCDGNFLEEEDEVLNIGQPIFESSICQSAAAVEQKSGTSEALREPVHISQTYNSGDFTVDSLYETTLPLEVQVKSKVVVPNQAERISRPASSTHPERKASSADQNRPKIFDNSMEWERQKRQYIFSVRSHMNENRGGAQGPMTELLDLMTHVAGQAGSNGSQWQHPSDLTCRNYQKRFGNETPTMTLSEWQAQNQTHYRRFSKVPKIFKRSPFP